ncbi:MAG: T9SS type A sorting domain-containing protein [Candidatus Latescibacteria bacterium]|nr:T9SS type A sorting domain-containing protein [Candidatus Latescibacterota bacterium]
MALEKKDWQVVEIPVEEFGLSAPLQAITFSGNFAGTFYLDDLRLVAATPPAFTVAEEERTTPLPQSFTLSQNYPDPVNSDTVIRFALPASAEVALSVYNLAGQRVAVLAEGVRGAGSYTVRWDGRDEKGHELASGVFLYRLRAGEKVETRKLALVH